MNKIEKVTVTGADDSTSIHDLVKINNDFTFVEFGILLSAKNEGSYRYPSKDWIESLQNENLNLSGHLCGRWVRDLCHGDFTFIAERPEWIKFFKRIQINFHGQYHEVNIDKMAECLKQFPSVQFIFQLDDVNNEIYTKIKTLNINVVPLFDISSGAGILPDKWPVSEGYCGYAGGLSPENVKQQIKLILEKAKDKIWIDAETKLRSNNDSVFDLNLVNKFLSESSEFTM